MEDFRGKIVEPALTWFDGEFLEGIQIACDQNGRIAQIGENIAAQDQPIVLLPDQALIPGFVNAHSHAFHWAMRGQSFIGSTMGSNFWGWRDNMYKQVEQMTAEGLLDVCTKAYKEMLAAGITTVGEFHYFHHSDSAEENRNYQYDRVILDAAKRAGIRIVLLETLYRRGGLKKTQCDISGAQRHFVSQSLREFWANFDNVFKILAPNQTLGVAAHSVRAVALNEIKLLRQEAEQRELPFHMHVEEQPAEGRDCVDEFGTTPSDFLLKELGPNESLTVVHATYTPTENVWDLLQAGANLCICPLTEGFLGDGTPRLSQNETLESHHLCLGTDCNNRLSMFEEMRSLVYCQQMRFNSRKVCGFDAIKLLKIATENGARSLGQAGLLGSFGQNQWFDFVSIDLKSKNLTNQNGETLLDGLVFGAGNEDIHATGVAGRVVHSKEANIRTKSASGYRSLSSCDSSLPEFLVGLMKIDSTTTNEGRLAKELEKYLTGRGWYVLLQPIENQLNRFNLLATRSRYASPGPKLLFNSHLDTVPPYIAPSRVKTENGRDIIKGRGSNDAKGQLAAMIFAAEKLAKTRPILSENVGLLFVVGEEAGHIGMRVANDLDLQPEYLVVGEPTELKFVKMQKGALKLHLTATGKAAHSGYPEMGVSAIEVLLDVLNDLRSEPWPQSPELGETTLNIGLIEGGQAANALAAQARATIMLRVTTDCHQILHRIREICNKRSIEIATSVGQNQLEIVQNQPVQLNEAPFDWPSQAAVAFNTDIAYFANAHRAKGVYLFGAGSITDAHSEWEYVRMEDLDKAADIYYKLAVSLLEK